MKCIVKSFSEQRQTKAVWKLNKSINTVTKQKNKSINTVTKQKRALTFLHLVINSTNDLQKKLKRLAPHHLFVKTQMRCFKNCITHQPNQKVEIHSVLP